MNDFKLCKEVGFYLYDARGGVNNYIAAEHVEAFLEKGVRVQGVKNEIGEHYGFNDYTEDIDTHTALLVNIQPIKQEQTAEDLLRDVMTYFDDDEALSERMQTKIQKARSFLAGRGAK